MPSSLSAPDLVSFRALVQHYHTYVLDVIARITAQYGAAHIEDVLDDQVPWAGELPGLTFHYHGLGFTAHLDGYTVHWDWFGDDMEEFNIWALGEFTQQREAEFGVWAEYSVLHAYVCQLEEMGVLVTVQPNESYRFANASSQS